MRTGRMDRIVTLKIRTVTGQDSYGEQTVTYADVPAWAERREFRGTERFTAQQRLATLDARYVIHYRDGIKATDRLTDGSNTYEIAAVLEIGRREGLELHTAHITGT